MGSGSCVIPLGVMQSDSGMRNIRLIARLDIKGPNLIKGIHLEGLRVIGSPNEFAHLYYQQGADELLYMDSVASLYGRNHLAGIISEAVKDIFVVAGIPIALGVVTTYAIL